MGQIKKNDEKQRIHNIMDKFIEKSEEFYNDLFKKDEVNKESQLRLMEQILDDDDNIENNSEV